MGNFFAFILGGDSKTVKPNDLRLFRKFFSVLILTRPNELRAACFPIDSKSSQKFPPSAAGHFRFRAFLLVEAGKTGGIPSTCWLRKSI